MLETRMKIDVKILDAVNAIAPVEEVVCGRASCASGVCVCLVGVESKACA